MNQPKGDDILEPLFLIIPPQNIVLLKFALESYEGIGVLRTLHRDLAQVVILAVKDTIQTVHGLIASLKEELDIQIIPPPEDISEDWLLGDAISFQDVPSATH